MARGATFYGPTEFWLGGGAAFPVGDFADGWDPGFALAGGLRSKVGPNVMGGLQVAYLGHPGLLGVGDAGILAVTSETDLYLRREQVHPDASFRPFLNVGLGYYHIFRQDPEAFDLVEDETPPREFEGDAFGLHGGVGVEVGRRRTRLRFDATYHHIFRGGDDIGDVPVRACLIFR